MVMPAYNAVEFIGVAIESVMAQTFTDWELVVVNDGSTDSTVEVVARYAELDSRIRLLDSPAPSGSAFAPRLRAVAEARASLVAPLDADDFVEEDYLALLMRRREESGASIVYPTMYRQPDGPDSPWQLLIPDPERFADAVLPGKKTVRFTLDGWDINCNGGVIDRELFMRNARWTLGALGAETSGAFSDEVFGRRLLYDADLVAFSGARYFYRDNENSITQKKSLRQFDFLPTHRHLLRLITDLYSSDSEEYTLMQRHLFHGVIGAFRQLNRTDFSHSERHKVYPQMLHNIALLDWPLLKKLESPIYYRFLRTLRNFPATARIVMRVGDAIHPPTPRT